MDEYGQKVVVTGTWIYDGSVPKYIEVFARPAKFAASRWNDDELDETIPIPKTPDGFVYYVGVSPGEFATLEEAKKWADAQPWGPVKWSEVSKL